MAKANTTSKSWKAPPTFNPDGGDSYLGWKHDLEVWKMYTKEEPKDQGLAVYGSLMGDARIAVRGIKVADLATDGGLKLVTDELDIVFMANKTTRAFCAFKEYVEYRRESGHSYAKFILEYSKRHRAVVEHEMILSDEVQAYFLLLAANIPTEHERLVRTTANLTLEDMKDKLQKVFGEVEANDGNNNDQGILPVKDESVFFTRNSRSR